MSTTPPINVTVRRGVAVITVLLAVNAVVVLNTVDAYQIGRSYHAVFNWVSLAAFWSSVAYLVGSVGYTVLVGHRSRSDQSAASSEP